MDAETRAYLDAEFGRLLARLDEIIEAARPPQPVTHTEVVRRLAALETRVARLEALTPRR